MASDLVRKANPDEDAESIDRLGGLLLKIRALVCKFKLTPCVRTKYSRIAFQSSSTNKRRFTLDKDVTVINERSRHRDSSKVAPSSWCLDDDELVGKEDVVRVPYCVYEVKVADGVSEQPAFVAELEDNRAIIEAKKFSKFLTGASIFNADLVATLPWWSEDAAFVPLYDINADDCGSQGPVVCCNAGDNSYDWAHIVKALPEKDAHTRTLDISDTTQSTASTSRSANLVKKSEKFQIGEPVDAGVDRGSGRPGAAGLTRSFPRSVRRRARIRHRSSTMSAWRSDRAPRVAPKTRLRVEPKSHFANERTYIQWMSAALLFVTLSELLYVLDGGAGETSAAATWMLAMALFIAVYALGVYYRRVHLMRSGKPYGYVDFVGPGVLATCIVSGIVLLLVYKHRGASSALDSTSSSTSTMVHYPGQCVCRSLEGPPGDSRLSLVMQLEPSGLVVDEARNLMLVPSLDRIIALRDGLPEEDENAAPVEIVATIPGADIEGLEYVDGRIFAVSEAAKKSNVIALEWSEESAGKRHLSAVHRWKLSLSGAEGLTLLSGKEGSSAAELLVAGVSDRNTKSIFVYDMDSFNFEMEAAEKKSVLNNRMVAGGLETSKVGSMQFFEGILWLLFDNSGMIRGFDPATGAMVQETRLPVSVRGVEKQWEGMRLQRITGSEASKRGLRGAGPGTTLVLHLAHDTPPQVWSLRLNEDGGGGERWTLPSCAVRGN